LVVGNHYKHKAIAETVEFLSNSFPTENIVVLGSSGDRHFHNVTFIKSGLIEESVVETLYAEARVVIFPSHYEGFGFPMVKAVAYGKPVFVRATGLVEEILTHLKEANKVKIFSFTDELAELVANCVFDTHASIIEVNQISWCDVANKITSSIQELIDSPDRGAKIRQRIFDLSLLDVVRNDDNCTKELKAVYNSKSWRLTRPLRVANKVFKDAFDGENN
jgi:glycosyltransferase involved in cell wall biosynthesis